jgi:hypothetical protein
LLGGAVMVVASPRAALAVAAAGSLAVTAVAWVALAGLGPHTKSEADPRRTEPQPDPGRSGPLVETTPAPAVRHQ